MPNYRYTALDEEGRKLQGSREASNELALGAILRRDGQWLAEARETSGRAGATQNRVRGKRVSLKAMEQFFLSLSLQLRAGVNVVTALSFGLDRDAPPSFHEVHADLLQRVRAGTPLSDAMAAHPKTFSVVMTNLLKAGEASGRLGEVCDEIRRHCEWSDRLAGDIRQALVYPITLLCATAVFFVIVFTFFIPRFSGVLKELGVPLPLLTRVMLDVSDFIMKNALEVSLSVVIPPVLFATAVKYSRTFAEWFDRRKLGLPFVGPIIWQTCLSRVVQNLATLYRAGIPLLDALKLCQPLVSNRVVQSSVAALRDGVAAGKPLHETMSQNPVFPPMVVQMTALGESTGTLDQSLQSVANYYDVIVPRAVKKLFSLFEPFMILGLLLVIGTVVLAVFLPIAAALGAK